MPIINDNTIHESIYIDNATLVIAEIISTTEWWIIVTPLIAIFNVCIEILRDIHVLIKYCFKRKSFKQKWKNREWVGER